MSTSYWIVEEDPHTASRRLNTGRRVLDEVPHAPFDLADLDAVWPVTVTSAAVGAAVVEAVTRGLAVVVAITGLDDTVADRLADDLERASQRSRAGERRGPHRLTEVQYSLLRALGEGATVTEAAGAVGVAPRTASRRLAEARRTLGVTSTAEAVAAVRRRRS